jgi:hypothetical protein
MRSLVASELKAQIHSAFRGVILGDGMSLLDAEEADCWGDVPEIKRLNLPPDVKITNDWTALSIETLNRYALLAHLDATGFRYYIPAFMCSLLQKYDTEMRCTSTLCILHPIKSDSLWDYHMNMYSALSKEQCHAIFIFLKNLPEIVDLDNEDRKPCDRAIKNYWSRFSQ